jgi:general stress protein YciG
MTATKKRGFAKMNAALQREIARKGGRVAHEKGKAHEFTREEAREAGRKGGKTLTPEVRLTVSLPRKRARPDAKADVDRAFKKFRWSLSSGWSRMQAQP